MLQGLNMTTDIQKKIKIPLILEYLALLTAIITPIFFIISHLSAYMLFSYIGIDYFKYTDAATAFSFALESLDIVLPLTILFTILIIAIRLLFFFHAENRQKDPNAFPLLNKPTAILLSAIVLILFLTMQLTDAQEPFNFKNTIINKQYIPYEISFDKGKHTLSCVTPFGSIGQFQVYMTEKFQPILIPKSILSHIKPLFHPVPIKQFTKGKKTFTNPKYEEEMKIWLKKWKDTCKPDPTSSFEIFDFKKPHNYKEWSLRT